MKSALGRITPDSGGTVELDVHLEPMTPAMNAAAATPTTHVSRHPAG